MKIITANSLGDGLVVFQTAGGWSFDVDLAEVLDTEEASTAALERANRDASANRVVEPYPIDVTREGARLVPVRLREKIRADGPTTGNSKSHQSAARAACGEAA